MHHGKRTGIAVYTNGRGRFFKNDIYSNCGPGTDRRSGPGPLKGVGHQRNVGDHFERCMLGYLRPPPPPHPSTVGPSEIPVTGALRGGVSGKVARPTPPPAHAEYPPRGRHAGEGGGGQISIAGNGTGCCIRERERGVKTRGGGGSSAPCGAKRHHHGDWL